MIEQLDLKLDPRGNVLADQNYMTSIPGIFSAGDMRRGSRSSSGPSPKVVSPPVAWINNSRAPLTRLKAIFAEPSV